MQNVFFRKDSVCCLCDFGGIKVQAVLLRISIMPKKNLSAVTGLKRSIDYTIAKSNGIT